jgi:hypothetical protein
MPCPLAVVAGGLRVPAFGPPGSTLTGVPITMLLTGYDRPGIDCPKRIDVCRLAGLRDHAQLHSKPRMATPQVRLSIPRHGQRSQPMQASAAGRQTIHPWVAEGLQRVRAGVLIAGPQPDWNRYHEFAQVAEEIGLDSLWVADHPMILGDCWTKLAALAVTTHRIRLGSLVSCVHYRNPVLLAQMAADVDRWSGGRLVLGLGIGDQPGEFAQLGSPFPGLRERQEALEETIQVVRGVMGPTPFTYEGKYVQARQSRIPFAPAQQPYIPLLTLPLVLGGTACSVSKFSPHWPMPAMFDPFFDEEAVPEVLWCRG